MPNRRNFIRTASYATAGLFVANHALDALAQTRREVSIGGQRSLVVDIHAHCVWPSVADIIEGTPLGGRTFPAAWTMGSDRIDVMDTRGIDIQALSVNGFWWYAADRNLASRIVREHDEQLAAWCAEHPDRFVALSSIALQFPDLAAEQLEFSVNELGARGASIGGHVDGEVPSSLQFDPFWAKAEELGVTVFMHPGGAPNVVQDDGLRGRGDLGNIIGNPLETTYFLTNMIFDGTLDRFPNLKICGAHSGGYLPSYLGRTEVACDVRGNANCANLKRPSEYLRDQIMIDSMIFSEEGLRHLVAEVGASQVVYGSDIPFNWPDTIDLIVDAPTLSDAEKIAILGGNLIELLRIDV
jgi:aminocarboxymuconate-semialdehyde decarboxylase